MTTVTRRRKRSPEPLIPATGRTAEDLLKAALSTPPPVEPKRKRKARK